MKDLIISKPYAEIYEVQLTDNNDNCLRVWCDQYRETIKLQIRTFKPITERTKNGKKRNMIAHITLNADEIMQIVKFAGECGITVKAKEV